MARFCGGGDSIFRASSGPSSGPVFAPLRALWAFSGLNLGSQGTHFGQRPLLLTPYGPLATALLVGIHIIYLSRRRSMALITKRGLALLLPFNSQPQQSESRSLLVRELINLHVIW